jgi:hypothetical protein
MLATWRVVSARGGWPMRGSDGSAAVAPVTSVGRPLLLEDRDAVPVQLD